jgi:hypothetical protein
MDFEDRVVRLIDFPVVKACLRLITVTQFALGSRKKGPRRA